MQHADTVNNSPAKWEGVIADLATKRQSAQNHVERLRAQKRELALEAGMGSADAKRRLEKTNAELSRLAFEVDDWDVAIAQAETAKREAEQATAQAAERARQEELAKMAAIVMRHAAGFTAALRKASTAGHEMQETIRNMIALCPPEKQRGLTHLLRVNPYMRAAEFVGMRNFLEFQSYPGPRDHIVALEDEVAVHLERWLQPPEEREN